MATIQRIPADESTLHECVEQLSQSEQGRSAMRHLLAWLDEDGLDLDATNKVACLLLLEAAWSGLPGTARDLMRTAVGGGC